MNDTRTQEKIFYIADLHLFHNNLIHPRDESLMENTLKARTQFSSIEEMHETIRSNWNNKVTDIDTVYILGDLGLYHADEIADFLHSLHGTKILIIGNHDEKNLKSNRKLRHEFADIRSYKVIRDGDERVVLFHYPIEQWDGYYQGFYHIHGHTHGDTTLKHIPHRYEASVEVTGYQPMTLDELKQLNNETILDS